MTCAIIRAGKVANVIVAEGQFIEWLAAQGERIVEIDKLDPKPAVGWCYDGTAFAPPPAPPPLPVVDTTDPAAAAAAARIAAARTTWANAPAAVRTQPLTAIAIALGIADPT